MRIAVVGKGGSGKSTISGTLARVLARRGHRVLALDADTVPGLAFSVGIEAGDDFLLEGLSTFEEGEGWKLTVPPGEVVERALEGPDGVRFLQFGKLRGQMTQEQRTSVATMLSLVQGFDDEGWTVVADLAAGTRQAYFGWTGASEQVLLVVEPTAKSLLTARRFVGLREVEARPRLLGVGNKIASEAGRRVVAEGLERLGIPLWAEVPADERVGDADREGLALLDFDPEAPAVRAIEEMAVRLEGSRASVDGERAEGGGE